MNLNALTALSPIDGRYRRVTNTLAPYYSEYGLIQYRVRIEIEYLIALHNSSISQTKLSRKQQNQLIDIYKNFNETDALQIKEIEKTTNHDVKAVEYFLKDKCAAIIPAESLELIHFGLTSQDINNTAIPLSIKEAMENVQIPAIENIISLLMRMAEEWKNIPMLARTHGQAASPTRLGKEILVFAKRLELQLNDLKNIPYAAKFGGATGNMNAHFIAYPKIDWHQFANQFVNKRLNLSRSFPTTQIEHYDYLAALFDNLARINTILIDFSRDIWQYISMDYFKQSIVKGEVGSSAMPHKVNPIDFENAEGNLGLASAVFHHLSAKLPISRLQRDLTDSTVLRNVSVPFAHQLIALASLEKGIKKLLIHPEKIAADLEDNWAVVAEAIQTVLRRESYPKPYEKLKELTRTNKKIDRKAIHKFITQLDISKKLKEELLNITPSNYTGK